VPNFAWGVPNLGGPLLTASGLVFIGAAAEYAFRAFDVHTGTELWKADLPTSAHATPVSYAIDGRQYVVIAVGGHHGLPVGRGDVLVAFALPR
jgi:quinoprotein glucose dehydrogenase